MDELTGVFVQESREQLAEMEAGLLALEADPEDASDINAIFRAAHTIKGGAGVVECVFLEGFTHKVENLLDQLRDGRLNPTEARISLLLDCADHIGQLLGLLERSETVLDAELQADDDALRHRLEQAIDAPVVQETAVVLADAAPAGGGSADIWHVSVRFGENVLRNGMDPIAFLRYLASLGDIRNLQMLADSMPAADMMDPEACYLGFEIRLETSVGKAEIEAVFDFVRDECELHILPPQSRSEDYIALINALPGDPLLLGEMLVRSGALTESELAIGLDSQQLAKAYADASPPIGEILIEHKSVRPEVVAAAINKQSALIQDEPVAELEPDLAAGALAAESQAMALHEAQPHPAQAGEHPPAKSAKAARPSAAEARMLRVQADKLDRLIDLVGELVIAGASATELARQMDITVVMVTHNLDQARQAGFALAAAAGFHFQIHQRHDGVQRQIAAEHFLRRDPNQARGNHVGIDAEIGHVEVVAVVVVEAAGVIVLAIHHAIHARRRQRTGHKAFHAVRVNGCAAFGGVRLRGQRQQGDGGENAGGAHGVSPGGCCVFLGGLQAV